ncbi:MAG: hypothetical protein MJ211_14780 [Bacteroidales bacterium]|nr:hypothetical protein [Bacteroidales bacterium]
MKKIYLTAIVLSLFVISCQQTMFNVDVSNIEADVDINRFDIEFDSISPTNIYYGLNSLKEKYGDFPEFYTEAILRLGNIESASLMSAYQDFSNYCIVNGIFDDVINQFPDLECIQKQFSDGAKHYKYYFPQDSLPKIFTIVSGFQESIFPTDGIVAISLDKYLGSDYPTYQNLGIENYKRRKMIPAMIPADYFKVIAYLNYPKKETSTPDLLNEMVYEGRVQYFLNCMLPDMPDSIRWGYSDIQYRWVETYEEEIWDYLVDKKLLFDKNPITVRNFTGEGPFTNAFGNNSAPGCATYCGYKIVCSFMKNNPNVSLKELMEITDMTYINSKARYNP